MAIRLPQAQVTISASLIPDPLTEPNITKELQLSVILQPNLSTMTVAYSSTIAALTLDGGVSTGILDLETGDVTSDVGTVGTVRSGEDAFGNELPSAQNEIGLILIEAIASNVDPVEISGAETGATLKNSFLRPGKWILANDEIPGQVELTFTTLDDAVRVTVLSKTA